MSSNKNPIICEKERCERKTVADAPMEVNCSFTLDVASAGGGGVVPFADVVDNFAQVETSIKTQICDEYATVGGEEYDLNFLLLDVKVKNLFCDLIDAPTVIGFSVGLPKLTGCSVMSGDGSSSAPFVKLIDITSPTNFVNGHRHSSVHYFAGDKSEQREHHLLSRNSKLLPKIHIPGHGLTGTHGVPPERYDMLGTTSLLHGYSLNPSNLYPKNNTVCMVQRHDDATSTNEWRVALPPTCYQRHWYKGANDDASTLKYVPVDQYTRDVFKFNDSVMQSRSTNFRHSALCFDTLHGEDVRFITGTLYFRFVPIVDITSDEVREHYGFNNLQNRIRDSLVLKNAYSVGQNDSDIL